MKQPRKQQIKRYSVNHAMNKPTESVEVIIREWELNPNCIHGPTVLFSSKQDNKKYFSCAGIRSKECFYLDFNKFQQQNKTKHPRVSKMKPSSSTLTLTHIFSLPVSQRIYCKSCAGFIESLAEHESHDIARGIGDEELREPSLFLPQLDDDKLNAQYFFDDTTLDFIGTVLEDLKLHKIICVGAPRLHDYIKKKKQQISSILLDIDDRFRAFNKPSEFIHYNMFNNYFFDGPEDEKKLLSFLKDDPCSARSHHCLLADPPFAARTELLGFSIQRIVSLYNEANSQPKQLPTMLIFPYFNEGHIRKEMPQMEMLEFQVSYMNHPSYREDFKGRKAGSPIRIFTNIDPRIVKYPQRFTNYRFCQPCHRFVSVKNLHCLVCMTCPSKNGATYRHCASCDLCVKPNYLHCKNCGRCVENSTHNCEAYQVHQECWLCCNRGHVEKNCDLMKRLKRRKDGTCMICKGNKKHHLKKCPSKWKFIKRFEK